MRKPARRLNRGQHSRVSSIPAPVGGWNARDSIADMSPQDAPTLINFWPTTSDMQSRKGFTNFATGLPNQVNTLAPYSPVTGAGKLFAASGTGIFDCSVAGPVGAAVVTGLTNSFFQKTQFSTPGGYFLYMVNGADKPQLYNGTTWVAVDAVSVPAITGVTTTSLIHVNSFKSRLFFIEKDSLNAWYLPVASVGGAASKLDFTSVFTLGGFLMAMGTWSLDGGYGMDDYAVFVTSNGEIAVYRGTDPSSATTWSLIGIFRLGSPMGRRCFEKYQGDLLFICKNGVAPLSKSLMSSRVNSRDNLTDKIQSAISAATTNYRLNQGWEIKIFPLENMLLLNVPVSETAQEQYTMNTITGSWARFQGWSANTFDVWNDLLYFGGNTVVAKAWDTYSDNGAIIYSEVVQAFSYFGTHQNKHFKACRPIFTISGSVGISIAVNVDFYTSPNLGSISLSPSADALWDTATWDGVGVVWADDGNPKIDWQYIGDMGIAASMHMKTATNMAWVRWAATDYLYEAGSVI